MYQKNQTIPAPLAALLVTLLIIAPQAFSAGGRLHADNRQVIEHWTHERWAAAIPRDLMIDQRGLGYLHKPDGSLEPYGHSIAHRNNAADQSGPIARGRPSGGNSDSTPPSISGMDPAHGAVIGANQVFSATVRDQSGVKSVSFAITYPDGVTTQSYNASPGYPFNRSKLVRCFIPLLAFIILGRWASSRRGSEPMRTAWTTSSGYGGLQASSVRLVATPEVGC